MVGSYGQLAQLGRAVHEINIGNLSWYYLKVSFSCTGRGVQVPHCPHFTIMFN